MTKHDRVAGFFAFTLAVSAATIAPTAHADLLSELSKDLKRVVHDATADSVNQTIDAATPASAKRAALGLPGERPTVSDRVIGRVMSDASRYTYGNYGSAKSALAVSGLQGAGALPGRSGSIGKSVKSSVSDVASDVTHDTIDDVTTKTVGKLFDVFIGNDDSPSR